MYSVTKRIDFCYGHRLLDYEGVCRHPHGHNAVVEYLLSTGADVGLAAPNGSTAVMLAVLGKKPDTVKLLASYGFDVNAKNHKGETALALAKREKNEEMEAVLRSLGAR